MKVLVVHPGPNFSVADVHDGWVEALSGLGCDVASYNLDDRLTFYASALIDTGEKDEDGRPLVRKAMPSLGAAWQAALQGVSHAILSMWPDVVMFISGFYLNPGMLALIRARRMKIVIVHTESPYQEETQLERASFADVNLLNDPVNIDRYRELDGAAAYSPHAYRPAIHHPRYGVAPDPDLNPDLAFIGTGYKSRIKFFEDMNLDGLDVVLGGAWPDLREDSPLNKYISHALDECVDNQETARIYRNAKCGINFYRREYEDETDPSGGWAVGPREIEMAACGLYFIRDPRGESDELFPMLPSFTSPSEATELVRWAKNHAEAREKAAMAARAAIADRTFDGNAKRLLRLLGA